MKTLSISLILILIFSTLTPLIPINAQMESSDIIDIEVLVPKETYTGFLFPRIGFPAFVTPGSTLEIVMYAPSIQGDILKAYLYKGGLEVNLDIKDISTLDNKLVITTIIPETYPGLYSLYVETSSNVYVEHNSIALKEEWSYPLTILRYSDTHYDNRRSGIRLRDNFLKIIWQANFLNPDFIIITGDILNSATDDNYQNLLKDMIAMLRVPIVMVPGNHDHHFEKDLFTYYLGPSNISINIGPLHLIVMDMGPGSLGGTVTNRQIKWLKTDLQKYGDMEVKIIASHHPFSLLDETAKSNKTGLEEFLSTTDVDLILHGHMHYVMVEDDKVPFRLTDPNAYEGGSPYSGFRLIYILGPDQIEWKYNDTPDPYPIFDLRVYEYQLQNGSNQGYYLKVENDMAIDIEGYITARIKYSDTFITEGISLDELEATEYPDYLELRGKILVRSGESRVIKIYGVEDDTPPIIKKISMESIMGKRVTEITYISVWDDVSGVADIQVYYTLDNETWEKPVVYRLTNTLYYTEIRHEVDNGFGLRIVLTDAEGNTFDSGLMNYSLILHKEPAEGAEAPPAIDLTRLLPIAGLVIIAVLVAIFYLRKKG
jgi:predicted phosphodiesterase